MTPSCRITRGIIEKSIDNYHVKVRIPSIDRMDTYGGVYTSTDNLSNAIVATVPGCEIQLKPGDVVIVAIDESEDSVTILGYLYRLESVDKHCNYNIDILNVVDTATLPSNTRIGNVTALELSYLSGLNEKLQEQLDAIKERLTLLEDK